MGSVFARTLGRKDIVKLPVFTGGAFWRGVKRRQRHKDNYHGLNLRGKGDYQEIDLQRAANKTHHKNPASGIK